jgi:class 3 adenylate cyclase
MNISDFSRKTMITSTIIWMLGIVAPSIAVATVIIGLMPTFASWLWPLFACFQLAGCILIILVQFNRRVRKPLEAFQTMLENITEGFMPEDVPKELHRQSDPVVSEAYRNVIQMNQMMLRHVDHLEKGYEEERRSKLRQIRLTEAYGRFVPHEFLDNLGKTSIIDIELGDHVRLEMTVLFSDIRGFTALSENMTPEQTFAFLNTYMSYMEPIIKQYDGFIDKFIGDAIMALFHSADQAVLAAIEMLNQLREFNQQRGFNGFSPIDMGIGLNTGTLMLGIVGGANRMEGTVVSDAVNIASRIESMTKKFNSRILISESTQAALTDDRSFTLSQLEQVSLEGKSKRISIYHVIPHTGGEA